MINATGHQKEMLQKNAPQWLKSPGGKPSKDGKTTAR